MHQTENETGADLFLTKACEEVWSQRIDALVPGLRLPSKVALASAFCYALSTGRVVFGIPVQELDDSYLIALPAVLVDEEGGVKGTSMVSEPIFRLFKSNILFVLACADKHLPAYATYVVGRKRLLHGLIEENALRDFEEVAKEHAVIRVFKSSGLGRTERGSNSSSEDDGRDEEDGGGNTGGTGGGVRSTIGWYYNKPTRH